MTFSICLDSYMDILIRPGDTHIAWSFAPNETVHLTAYNNECWVNGMYTYVHLPSDQLLAILEHPDTRLEELLAGAVDIKISYWILFDIRDTALDPDTTNIPFKRDPATDFRREEPLSTLDAAEKVRLRTLLQRFPTLIADFTYSGVYSYGPSLKAAYVGVLRSFPNIGELNYGCDKYGWSVKEHIWDCYRLWGAKSARLLYLIGFDDNCDIGYWDPEHNFLQECQNGNMFGGSPDISSWDELAQYMGADWVQVARHMDIFIPDVVACIGTPAFLGMRQFTALDNVSLTIGLALKKEHMIPHASGEQYWVLDIPPMPRMRSFCLLVDSIQTDADPILIFRFGECPVLKEVVIHLREKSNAWGVVVRPGRPWELVAPSY